MHDMVKFVVLMNVNDFVPYYYMFNCWLITFYLSVEFIGIANIVLCTVCKISMIIFLCVRLFQHIIITVDVLILTTHLI